MSQTGEITLERILDAEKGTFAFQADCSDAKAPRVPPRLTTGNFSQAYTHVGLINTEVTISELIEARDARFRAWS